MASTYTAFLQAPNTSLLTTDATLNYITTTTVISDATAIIKHLASQQKLLEKKSEKILNTIEGPDSLFLETETTLKFDQGGGAYLPSLDENLLDEKIAVFPLLHVVHFDPSSDNKKIKQIRLYWDQGTLLKQVEAIGRTGRNWPIRDGTAQLNAINKSIKSIGSNTTSTESKVPLGPRSPNEVTINSNPKRDSVGALRNHPGATYSFVSARDPNEEAGGGAAGTGAYEGPKHAVRDSARPAPRDMGELFVGEEAVTALSPGSLERSQSPSKANGILLKSGAGKHVNKMRLFDENDEGDDVASLRSPSKKTYGQKYEHFSFGDGEDVVVAKRLAAASIGGAAGAGNKKGHQPTFSFEDFHTPPKYSKKKRPDDEVHWGNEDEAPPSPPNRPIVHAPRKDAESHFALTDPPMPTQPLSSHHDDPTSPPTSSGNLAAPADANHNIASSTSSAPQTGTTVSKADVTATNVDSLRRGADFGKHYEFTDQTSLSAAEVESEREKERNQHKGNRATRSDLDQHWNWGTPEPERKIYKTAGDGMGGRSGARKWGFGDEEY